MEGVARGPGRVRAGLAPEGAGRDQGRRVPRRDLALRGRLAPARPWRQHHPPEEIAGRERRGPPPDPSPEGPAKLGPVVRNGQVRRHGTGRNLSPMDRGGGGGLLASGPADQGYGPTPAAGCVVFSVAGCAPGGV